MALISSATQLDKSSDDTKIKVLVVDDSIVLRRIMSDFLMKKDDVVVVDKARNGSEALEMVTKHDIDVVILDIEMPVMDGLTALPLIVKQRPHISVIIASTLTQKNARASMKSLELGAKDYVSKPEASSLSAQNEFFDDLYQKTLSYGQFSRRKRLQSFYPSQPLNKDNDKNLSRGLGALSTFQAESKQSEKLRAFNPQRVSCLAIGSSTGGPQALTKLMPEIKFAANKVPVFITQHMPPTFTKVLAEHLAQCSGLECVEAVEGMIVRPGVTYVAPGGYHLKIRRGRTDVFISLDNGPPVNYCKPSVDVMFDSLLQVYGRNILATVLTGMGSDGAASAKRIADAGGNVFAQDKESSVVWGMPRATMETGACSHILPLDQMGLKITRVLTGVYRE